ncbi:MAG: gas vesicle accessory protein GvpU [Pseudomonas helleri]|uniref:gas vesicle accessory protein GvpU n=1 Tax=Pseudomonas helleri TaxID=1608996 RepID=UPI003FD5EE4A
MTEAEYVAPKDLLKADLSDGVFDKTQWEGRGVDGLLQWIVEIIMNSDISIGISLTIGGNIVSGMLIPHKKYFEKLSEDFSRPFDPESAAVLKERILSFIPPQHDGDDGVAPQFLHLEHAQIITVPSGALTSEGMLWRGKISAVEGFSLGRLINGN